MDFEKLGIPKELKETYQELSKKTGMSQTDIHYHLVISGIIDRYKYLKYFILIQLFIDALFVLKLYGVI